MIRLTLFIASIFYFSFSFAQTKVFNGVLSRNGDTSLWYKYQNVAISDLSLNRLDTSLSTFYFRIWKANQVLDIWQRSENEFLGQITTWVTEKTPAKEKTTNRIFIDKRPLESDTVQQILSLIKETQIIKIPTDDSIKGWKHGVDGITYRTEFSSKISYSFKKYWTPKVQDSTLKEAKRVQIFVDKIFELSNGTIIWNQFVKTIPYECYNIGGVIFCKIVTKKQKRKLVKERKKVR